jgi:hypothetical protein
VKCNQHRERRNAFGRAVVRGHRRTRRSRLGRARRGVGVTAGHYTAPASTRACRPWQVAGLGDVDPPTGAPPVARHWPPERRTSPAMPSASLHMLVAPAHPYLPQLTFPRAYKPASVVPARTHASTRAAAVRHYRRSVGTIFQSLSSRTQELQPFPVHHNTSPSCLLFQPSHPFAGTRVSRGRRRRARSSAASPSPVTCLAPSLGPVSLGRAAAALPPPLTGAFPGRSTATNRSRVSLIDDPCRMFVWPSPTSPPASWSPPSGPRGKD